MTLKDYERLQELADKDVALEYKFDTIQQRNLTIFTDIQKWTKLYAKQQLLVSDLTVELESLYTQLFNAYKFPDKKNNPYNLDLNHFWGDKPNEIKIQIMAVPVYVEKAKELNIQKEILTFIDKTLANLKDIRFAIKNYIDMQQLLTSTM